MLGLDEKFPEVQFLLGFLSFQGLGAPQDRTAAFSHYLESAKAGCPAAQYAVGMMIHSTQAYGNPNQATYWLEEAARQGHRSAAFDLGALLTVKNASPGAVAQGVAWLERAVTLGSVAAALRLATLCEEDEVITRDNAKAREWYEKAASLGSPAAHLALANGYRRARLGLPHDIDKATELEKRAAELQATAERAEFEVVYAAATNGSRSAQQILATVYSKGGMGRGSDLEKARYWASKVDETFPEP